jgi:CRP-like cAMP-binding protein
MHDDEVTADSFEHLRRSGLFRDVESDVLHRLAPVVRLERVAKGAILSEAAFAEPRVAVIRRGEFLVELQVGSASRIVASRLGAGDEVGIETLFGSPSARLRATMDALLLSISAQRFRTECFRSSALARNVAASLASRLSAIVTALVDLRYAEPAHHVLAALVGVSRQFGVPLSDGVLLDVALAESDIATIAACREGETAPALRLLEREGFLRMNGPSIVILSREANA